MLPHNKPSDKPSNETQFKPIEPAADKDHFRQKIQAEFGVSAQCIAENEHKYSDLKTAYHSLLTRQSLFDQYKDYFAFKGLSLAHFFQYPWLTDRAYLEAVSSHALNNFSTWQEKLKALEGLTPVQAKLLCLHAGYLFSLATVRNNASNMTAAKYALLTDFGLPTNEGYLGQSVDESALMRKQLSWVNQENDYRCLVFKALYAMGLVQDFIELPQLATLEELDVFLFLVLEQSIQKDKPPVESTRGETLGAEHQKKMSNLDERDRGYFSTPFWNDIVRRHRDVRSKQITKIISDLKTHFEANKSSMVPETLLKMRHPLNLPSQAIDLYHSIPLNVEELVKVFEKGAGSDQIRSETGLGLAVLALSGNKEARTAYLQYSRFLEPSIALFIARLFAAQGDWEALLNYLTSDQRFDLIGRPMILTQAQRTDLMLVVMTYADEATKKTLKDFVDKEKITLPNALTTVEWWYKPLASCDDASTSSAAASLQFTLDF